MDPRFTVLEEKITFVEQQLGDLDGVVRDLGDTLEKLARRLDRLAGNLEQHLDAEAGTRTDPEASSDAGTSDDDLRADRPPHW